MGTASRDFERDREDEIHCRICASDIPRNDGVHIFAEDGRRHYLQTKIRKYLYILVSLPPLRVNQRDCRCMRAYMYIHTVSCVGLTCVRIFFRKLHLVPRCRMFRAQSRLYPVLCTCQEIHVYLSQKI